MGRELPFALGSGDLVRARRIAATALAWNAACERSSWPLAFLVPLLWSAPPARRGGSGLLAMAVVGASNLYLAYLSATFRSDSDFALSRARPLAAGDAVAADAGRGLRLGFAGLCLHAALQSSS